MKKLAIAKYQLEQIKNGTLPKHKNLVTDVGFLENFIKSMEEPYVEKN